MTVTTDQYLSAQDLIDHRLIDVLHGWMLNEKRNLDDFIANPQGHVNYSPFMIPDSGALQQRSTQLQQYADSLLLISQYKQGLNNIQQSQSQASFDAIPRVIFERLLVWMKDRLVHYEEILATNGSTLLPLDEYGGLATFDKTNFQQQIDLYSNAINGVETIVQYKVESGQ